MGSRISRERTWLNVFPRSATSAWPPFDYREEHYQVLARTAEGKRLGLAIDPLSGAVWHERT